MSVKLLTEHHLEFLSLKGCCTCSSKSTLVKMPHCWKSHIVFYLIQCILESGAISILVGLTGRTDPGLKLNGIWGLMVSA